MEIDPQADECQEIFEQFIDELPFDEVVTAVRGLREYQQQAEKELFKVMGWEQFIDEG